MASCGIDSQRSDFSTNTNNMNDFLDAPPEGAVPTASESALRVQYKAHKTPKAYAAMANETTISEAILEGHLGFLYYSKEEKRNVPIPDFTFIVLEVYAGISGFNEKTKTSYWSNRVLNSATEEMIVFESGPQKITSGLYQTIKPSLPEGANYAKFVKAYCIQLDRVVEIQLTKSSERGMQKAVSAAESAAGRNTDWKKVFILGLARNDHFWGFHLKGYLKETREGEVYAGEGELYFAPDFRAGIVNPVKSPDLYAKCVSLQNAERAAHERYKEKYRSEQEPTSAPQTAFPTTAQTPPISNRHENGFPTVEMVTEPEAGSFDDLPF